MVHELVLEDHEERGADPWIVESAPELLADPIAVGAHFAGTRPGETVVGAIAFDKDSNISLYRLVVTVNLRMRDVKNSAVLFQQNSVQEQADFRVLGQVSQTISREETALRAAATEIGRAIVALAVTRF